MSRSHDTGGSKNIVLKQPPMAGCPVAVGLFPVFFHIHHLISSPKRFQKLVLAEIIAPALREKMLRTGGGNTLPKMNHAKRASQASSAVYRCLNQGNFGDRWEIHANTGWLIVPSPFHRILSRCFL